MNETEQQRAIARKHYKEQHELSWDEVNALWEGLPPGSDDDPLGAATEASEGSVGSVDGAESSGDDEPAAGDGAAEAEAADADAVTDDEIHEQARRRVGLPATEPVADAEPADDAEGVEADADGDGAEDVEDAEADAEADVDADDTPTGGI